MFVLVHSHRFPVSRLTTRISCVLLLADSALPLLLDARFFFFFNDPAPPEIYPLSLPDALPIWLSCGIVRSMPPAICSGGMIRNVGVAYSTPPITPRGMIPPTTPTSLSQPRTPCGRRRSGGPARDRKSTRLNSSHGYISYAVFCL